jgi:hypothetical protein
VGLAALLVARVPLNITVDGDSDAVVQRCLITRGVGLPRLGPGNDGVHTVLILVLVVEASEVPISRLHVARIGAAAATNCYQLGIPALAVARDTAAVAAANAGELIRDLHHEGPERRKTCADDATGNFNDTPCAGSTESD